MQKHHSLHPFMAAMLLRVKHAINKNGEQKLFAMSVQLMFGAKKLYCLLINVIKTEKCNQAKNECNAIIFSCFRHPAGSGVCRRETKADIVGARRPRLKRNQPMPTT